MKNSNYLEGYNLQFTLGCSAQCLRSQMDFDRVEGAKSSGEMSMSAMIYFLRPVGQVLVFFSNLLT